MRKPVTLERLQALKSRSFLDDLADGPGTSSDEEDEVTMSDLDFIDDSAERK